MTGKGAGPKDLDVMALLHEVHGDAAGARGEAVELALHAMEVTHRQASLAMRQFERSGRVHQGATGGRAGNAAAPGHGPRGLVPTRGAGDELAAKLPPARQGSTAAPVSSSAGRSEAEEVTAVWRPTPEPMQRQSAPAGPSGPPPSDAAARGKNAAAEADRGDARPPASEGAANPVQVFAGQGAQVRLREPTRTQRMPRPKR